MCVGVASGENEIGKVSHECEVAVCVEKWGSINIAIHNHTQSIQYGAQIC